MRCVDTMSRTRPPPLNPWGFFCGESEQQGRRSDIELLGGQRLLAPASSAAPRSTAPMKSAKQVNLALSVRCFPGLSCVFHQAGGHACFLLPLISAPFWCRKAFDSAYRRVLPFGPSCCMRVLALLQAGRVHVVRCADLLGCVGDGGAR